jgi:AraC family transcriptional regulator
MNASVRSPEQPRTIRLAAGQFLGAIARRLDVDDLLLRETRHGSGQVIPPHVHESVHFSLGVAGSCLQRIHGRDMECVPGTIEFHPAGTVHSSQWGSAGGRCFTLTIGTAWLGRVAVPGRTPWPRAGVLGPSARELMSRLHRELLFSDHCSPMAVEGLTLALFAVAGRNHASRASGAPPGWLSRAEEYLRDHAFGPVRAADAARAAGVHPVVLSRWFSRAHGMTAGEFVRGLRIERACRLLVSTALPLTEIALACGFADHSHFTRVFRRAMHGTPSGYRRRQTGNTR